MAKILISSIGSGDKSEGRYQEAIYRLEGKEYKTTFIADALRRHHGFDKIFLVGTTRSIWDEVCTIFQASDQDLCYELYAAKEEGKIDENLLKRLHEQLPFIHPKLIRYGLSEDELWENFSAYLQIADDIADGDEIYLDITHSFRSLALMSFVMTRFARSVSEKRFEIAAVYYGMFEYRNENDGKTPVVNLKILVDIADWIEAIEAIKNHSDFRPLVRLMEKSDVEKETRKVLIQLNDTLSLANFVSLKKFIELAAKKIKTIERSQNRIIRLLAPEIFKIVQELDHEKMSDFQFALAKWLYKNNNYALSYIALYEAIITKSCEMKGCDPHGHKNREEEKKSIGNDRFGKLFYTKYPDSISKIRNAIVHQSRERQGMEHQDIVRLGKFLKIFEEYFKTS